MPPSNATVINRAVTIEGPGRGNADRIWIPIEDKLWEYGPNMNPLTRMANVMKKRSVPHREFKVLNDKRLPRFTRINENSGYNTTAVTITVDNGNYFRVQDVIEITRTGEHCLVTGISGNDLTVVRNYATGGTPGTGVAMVDNDEIRILGQAQSERSATPSTITTDPGTVTNYTQLISRSSSVSLDRTRTDEYGPKEKQRQSKQAMDEIKIDNELNFKFGKPLKDVEGDSPRDSSVADSRYATAGIKWFVDNFASDNVLDANEVITQTTLWGFVAPLFENMPDDSTNQNRELVALCGMNAFHAFHQWGLSRVETTPDMKKFGMQLTTYLAPPGRLNLVQDYSLTGDEYSNYMFVINPMDLEYVYTDGHDVHIETNKQMPNVKEIVDEIWGEVGLGIKRPELHGYVYNMKAGA